MEALTLMIGLFFGGEDLNEVLSIVDEAGGKMIMP